jgi:hypothetical protein
MPDDLSTKDDPSQPAGCEAAKTGMAIMRLGLGAMFLYVFFENLSKGLYSKNGYAGLINYYVEKVLRRERPCSWLLEERDEFDGQPCSHRRSSTGCR